MSDDVTDYDSSSIRNYDDYKEEAINVMNDANELKHRLHVIPPPPYSRRYVVIVE